MRENKKILFVLVGSVIAGLGIYAVLEGMSKVNSNSHSKDKTILLPDDKDISRSAKEFVERRRQRVMTMQGQGRK